MTDFWRIVLDISHCWKSIDKGSWLSWALVTRDSEIIGSDNLEVLLRLSLCQRNTRNYRQNDEFLETCLFVNNLVDGNSLRYFNKNWRKSLVPKANIKFFRIFFWIWIRVSNMCLNNNSCKIQQNLFQSLQSPDGEISILFHRGFIILRVQRLQYIKNTVLSEMVPFLKSKLLIFFSSQWNLPYQITVFANCVVKTWTSRWALHCF